MSKPAPRIRDVAERVGRLLPDWRNPERYFETRSEIEHELKKLAQEMEGKHG